MESLKPYLTLCRVYIAFFAACSAATGFFLAPYNQIAGVLNPAAAVFLLACGASAMNQYQERVIDAKMERTRRRPVPSGAIAPAKALFISLSLILAGLILLAYAGGVRVAAPGLAAVVWYNGVYTPLKKVTAFASVPGALVGMIPPVIGWASAGGVIADARLAAICFIYFMWQVPHFWILVLSHGEEYAQAGLPSLTRIMSRPQIARIAFVWIVAASVATLALPLYGSVRSPAAYLAFIPLGAWLIWNERSLTGKLALFPCSSLLFRKINIYLFLMMSLLTLDGIIIRVL